MPLPSLSSIGIGIETLRTNPLRTVLSTLGVIIGVAALVAVLALGDGMEKLGRREIERTTDVQTVVVAPRLTEEVDGRTLLRTDYPVFTAAEAEAAAALPGVRGVSLVVGGNSVIEAGRGERRAAGVSATLASAADFHALEFATGRYFTEVEAARNSPIVILSHKLADELAAGLGASSMVGRTVRVNGEPRRVIGVLAPYKGERTRSAYVPLRAARSALPAQATPRAPTLYLKAGNVETVSAVKSAAEDWLARRYGAWERRVKVETSAARLEQVRQGMATFKLFLGAITGISLVVGGIGIMNVLLASVTERTREIGVRKAIGARPADILAQFLAESVAIAGVGSGIGLVLGILAAFGITALVRAQSEAPLYAGFSASSLVVVVAAAVLVGISFGIYPALRASRLSPIDAIRHE
jgi:putative ABC transport system permease protein